MSAATVISWRCRDARKYGKWRLRLPAAAAGAVVDVDDADH